MSTKSIAEKLRINPDSTIWSSHPTRLDLVAPLPQNARRVDAPDEATIALVFADGAAALRDILAAHAEQLLRPDIVWVCYPKGNRADINRDNVWPILGEYGMRPVGQVALDEVWSALRFRALQDGEAPFTGGRG